LYVSLLLLLLPLFSACAGDVRLMLGEWQQAQAAGRVGSWHPECSWLAVTGDDTCRVEH
jgi:hypothetical protein